MTSPETIAPRTIVPAQNNFVQHYGSAYDTSDIVTAITQQDDNIAGDTANFAPYLVSGNINDTCFNIWLFIKSNITYVEDPDNYQFVKLPAKTYQDGYGDCKSYSLFIASCLQNIGIPYIYRFISQAPGSGLHHVYVVAYDEGGNELPVDAVLNHFGVEDKYVTNKDVTPFTQNIKVPSINGVGNIGKKIYDDMPQELADTKQLFLDYFDEPSAKSAIAGYMEEGSGYFLYNHWEWYNLLGLPPHWHHYYRYGDNLLRENANSKDNEFSELSHNSLGADLIVNDVSGYDEPSKIVFVGEDTLEELKSYYDDTNKSIYDDFDGYFAEDIIASNPDIIWKLINRLDQNNLDEYPNYLSSAIRRQMKCLELTKEEFKAALYGKLTFNLPPKAQKKREEAFKLIHAIQPVRYVIPGKIKNPEKYFNYWKELSNDLKDFLPGQSGDDTMPVYKNLDNKFMWSPQRWAHAYKQLDTTYSEIQLVSIEYANWWSITQKFNKNPVKIIARAFAKKASTYQILTFFDAKKIIQLEDLHFKYNNKWKGSPNKQNDWDKLGGSIKNLWDNFEKHTSQKAQDYFADNKKSPKNDQEFYDLYHRAFLAFLKGLDLPLPFTKDNLDTLDFFGSYAIEYATQGYSTDYLLMRKGMLVDDGYYPSQIYRKPPKKGFEPPSFVPRYKTLEKTWDFATTDRFEEEYRKRYMRFLEHNGIDTSNPQTMQFESKIKYGLPKSYIGMKRGGGKQEPEGMVRTSGISGINHWDDTDNMFKEQKTSAAIGSWVVAIAAIVSAIAGLITTMIEYGIIGDGEKGGDKKNEDVPNPPVDFEYDYKSSKCTEDQEGAGYVKVNDDNSWTCYDKEGNEIASGDGSGERPGGDSDQTELLRGGFGDTLKKYWWAPVALLALPVLSNNSDKKSKSKKAA